MRSLTNETKDFPVTEPYPAALAMMNNNEASEKLTENKETEALEERTDEELMMMCAEDNLVAFDELYRRYARKIFFFARRYLRSAEDADDVMQEVFMRAFRNRKKYTPEGKFSSWLFRIARNLCVDKTRKYWRRKVTPESQNVVGGEEIPILELVPAEIDNSLEVMQDKELHRRLEEAIDKLPKRQRSVVILHRYNDMSYKEIAEILGTSPESIKQCAYRAHLRLRELMADFMEG